MLSKSEAWKKDFKVVELYNHWHQPEEERRAILTAWPQYFHKTDKEGRPLYVQHCNVDPNALFKAASADRLVEHFVVDFVDCIERRYPACEEATGKSVDDSLIVMQMQGVSLSSFWSVRNLLLRIIEYSQNYFPWVANSSMWSHCLAEFPAQRDEWQDSYRERRLALRDDVRYAEAVHRRQDERGAFSLQTDAASAPFATSHFCL